MKIIHGIYHLFDRLEDHIRAGLARHMFVYTFIGGMGIVLFWRGIWHTADVLEGLGGIWGLLFSPLGSIVLAVAILLATGLFVSMFIGDSIIISGINNEKKRIDKAVEGVREVGKEIEHLEERAKI
jgi:hypothetical protein